MFPVTRPAATTGVPLPGPNRDRAAVQHGAGDAHLTLWRPSPAGGSLSQTSANWVRISGPILNHTMTNHRAACDRSEAEEGPGSSGSGQDGIPLARGAFE